MVRAGMLGGLAIPDARSTRIVVDDAAALVLVRRGGPPEVLAAPGTISRIAVAPGSDIDQSRFLPTATHGLVGFFAGERVVAALSLREMLAPGVSLPPDDLHAVTGLDAVAGVLGLEVAVPTDQELRALRALRQHDLTSFIDPALRSRRDTWLVLLGAVLGFATLPTAGAWWSVVPALLVLGVPTLALWRRRRAFARLVGTSPDPGDRVALTPRPAGRVSGNLAGTELQVGAHDVVLRTEGREWWLPGPAAGGVTGCRAHGDDLALTGASGQQVLLLDGQVWGDAAADLRVALAGAGIEVVDQAGPYPGDHLGPGGTRLAMRHWPLEDLDLTNGGGSLLRTSLLQVALWLLLAGTLATAYQHPAAGLVAPLLALGLVGLGLDAARLHAGWVRRQRAWAPRRDR